MPKQRFVFRYRIDATLDVVVMADNEAEAEKLADVEMGKAEDSKWEQQADTLSKEGNVTEEYE